MGPKADMAKMRKADAPNVVDGARRQIFAVAILDANGQEADMAKMRKTDAPDPFRRLRPTTCRGAINE
jgi:hypothetical protein